MDDGGGWWVFRGKVSQCGLGCKGVLVWEVQYADENIQIIGRGGGGGRGARGVMGEEWKDVT